MQDTQGPGRSETGPVEVTVPCEITDFACIKESYLLVSDTEAWCRGPFQNRPECWALWPGLSQERKQSTRIESVPDGCALRPGVYFERYSQPSAHLQIQKPLQLRTSKPMCKLGVSKIAGSGIARREFQETETQVGTRGVCIAAKAGRGEGAPLRFSPQTLNPGTCSPVLRAQDILKRGH